MTTTMPMRPIGPGICREIAAHCNDLGAEEPVMSWNGNKVVAAPSTAGDGIHNLWAGSSLIGVLSDDGGQWRIVWRRGHADEPKWVKPAEVVYDTVKEAARAVVIDGG